MFSGSGCISIALAHHLREHPTRIRGFECSKSALKIAQKSAAQHSHKLKRYKNRVGFLFHDLRQPLPEGNRKCDLIVANPPYVTPDEYEGLDFSIRKYEDRNALVGELDPLATSGDGLAYYRLIVERIASGNIRFLTGFPRELPRLVLEVGAGQASAVAALCRRVFARVEIEFDQYAVERSVWCYELSL